MKAEDSLAKSRALHGIGAKSLARLEFLADRDGGWFCAYCDRELTPATAVNEHVVPRSRGGANDHHNRVLSCAPCDREKANRTPQEWQPGVSFGSEVIDKAKVPPKGIHARPQTLGAAHRRRNTGLTFKAAVGIAWCATCSLPVDEVLHRHKFPSHLLLESTEHEPS